MIRRICCGYEAKLDNLDLFNFEKFIKYCKELDIAELTNEVNNIVSWTPIDAEAEACALGCEMIINRFNGDNRSFDEIKEEYINKLKGKIKERYERDRNNHTDA